MTATPNAGRRVLTVTTTARVLDVSEATVRRWADAGHLPCQRTPGGTRRFLADDVDSLLRSMDAASVPA
ncbi:helix-turn-helix domain-containing protein [Pseudonocardia hydrocarbonoxydans]|uniref:helix-turn-helix domain-containing protein n=1 Tax=Pseudonocardia hydrocarbonoxydans TaxID=76726 RepID=UPI0031D5634F